MWFKFHRNVNDIRKQIIAFIKKHIIILFTHKSIHNSDGKDIKYRMSYPRWSTSLVVNKQFWSDQSAVDQNETSKRNQLPHDPTDTDIRKCTKKSCPLRHKWLHQQNTRMRDKHVNITWVADFRATEEDKQTSLWCIRSSINSWTSTETNTSDLVTAEPEVNIGSSRRVQLWHSQKLLPKNSTRMEPPTRHHSWGQLHRGVQG